MKVLRWIATFGAAATLPACADLAELEAPPPAAPAPAFAGAGGALFADVNFVDFDPTASDGEASNLLHCVQAAGVTVATFTGYDAPDFAAALSGRRFLFMPEIEIDDLDAFLSPAARAAVAAFVDAGGTLAAFHPNFEGTAFLNGVFGWTLAGLPADVSTLNGGAVAGTVFAGGPASLADLSSVYGLDPLTLPASATSVYRDAANLSVVTVIPRGAGRVVVLGWDWYQSPPFGVQDGGWLDVLARTTQY